jgi:hypothetical protein
VPFGFEEPEEEEKERIRTVTTTTIHRYEIDDCLRREVKREREIQNSGMLLLLRTWCIFLESVKEEAAIL